MRLDLSTSATTSQLTDGGRRVDEGGAENSKMRSEAEFYGMVKGRVFEDE